MPTTRRRSGACPICSGYTPSSTGRARTCACAPGASRRERSPRRPRRGFSWMRMGAGRSRRGLRLAREGAGHADRARTRYHGKLAALDPDMLSLTLRRILRVHDLQEEAEPPVQETGQTYRTPEGRYLVELLEGTDYAMAKG